MREKGYYSVRTGKHAGGAKLDLAAFKKLLVSIHRQFQTRDYFQEAFGYNCVDAGEVPGSLGEDVEGAIFIAIRKDNLWPIWTRIDDYTEDDLFDVIEFLYDSISKPIDGYFHSYSGCGMHYTTFNRSEGQVEFRGALNPVLACYQDGYQISDIGEILTLPEIGMSPLLEVTC